MNSLVYDFVGPLKGVGNPAGNLRRKSVEKGVLLENVFLRYIRLQAGSFGIKRP